MKDQNSIEIQTMDKNTLEETYKFLNALLDDYSACKTTLARDGIIVAYRQLVDKIHKDHLNQLEKSIQLEKDLAAAKKKIPKTEEEIKKLLHEFGFHELELVDDFLPLDDHFNELCKLRKTGSKTTSKIAVREKQPEETAAKPTTLSSNAVGPDNQAGFNAEAELTSTGKRPSQKDKKPRKSQKKNDAK